MEVQSFLRYVVELERNYNAFSFLPRAAINRGKVALPPMDFMDRTQAFKKVLMYYILVQRIDMATGGVYEGTMLLTLAPSLL